MIEKSIQLFSENRQPLSHTAKSDEIAHPMNLRTQYHKTVSWNCKRSMTLLQTNEENILPYTVKIDSARASAGPKGGLRGTSPQEAMSALKNFFSCTAERKGGGTNRAVTPSCK